MDLRQLRYFVVLARKQHFTQAAEELFIAQPALSQQIQGLERDLGVRLFERSSRRVWLTPAGKVLLVRAEQLLMDAESLQDEMRAFANVERGRIAIGLLQSLGASWLPGVLARFHEKHQGIEIVLRENVTEQLLEELVMGTLDIVFMHTIGTVFPAMPIDRHITVEPVQNEALLLAVSEQHSFTRDASVKVKQLRNEPFIVFKPGSGLRQAVFHLGQSGGFAPRVLFESGDIGTIRSLVAEGVGISVFPRSIIEAPGRKIVPVQVQPVLPERTIVVAWHKRIQQSLVGQAFLAFFRESEIVRREA